MKNNFREQFEQRKMKIEFRFVIQKPVVIDVSQRRLLFDNLQLHSFSTCSTNKRQQNNKNQIKSKHRYSLQL